MPSSLGPYLLLERFAVGGMAEVFLAVNRDDEQGEVLVVKCILPHLQHMPDVVQMFLDEVRLTSLLRHPNIVEIYDFGSVGEVHFIAMQHVDGISLTKLLRWLKPQLLPHPLACWLMAEACAGLAYAHSREMTYTGQKLGIVHRDVNPANILLSKSGEVKLADFGIAKATMRLSKTTPGQLKGKYCYMSPEQCSGGTIDHRSDIFSIGVVLYELTTGHDVFPGSPEAIFRALRSGIYTPPEEVIPGFPAPLAEIVNRALRWDPELRFGDAREIQGQLMRLIRGEDLSEQLASLVTAACAERDEARDPGGHDALKGRREPATTRSPFELFDTGHDQGDDEDDEPTTPFRTFENDPLLGGGKRGL